MRAIASSLRLEAATVMIFASTALAAWAAAPAAPVSSKSVFISDQKDKQFGRDPFFPASRRFNPEPIKPVVPPTPPPQTKTNTPTEVAPAVPLPPPPAVDPKLILNGVIGRRLAIINGNNLVVGDEFPLNAPEGKFSIRLEKVGSDSVTVSITPDGGKARTKELPLIQK